ncbi:MAG: phosphoglucomutase/phosphomannomutase family protein [Proteobacteria bacterium]|nr:phosphoglucomutase/phosphomannomutase family protein [Pseudomonadota bacterium]
MAITFGTSGWRGIIADDFTFANVRLCAQALADRLKAIGKTNGKVFIGYDTRFLGREFADAAAAVLTANGFDVFAADAPVPTPAVDAAVLHHKAVAGINFTASHNPPSYNGFKYIASWGGIARNDETDDLTKRVAALSANKVFSVGTPVDRYDFRTPYLAQLLRLVGPSSRSLKILVNPMYGTSADYLPELLTKMGHKVEVMNAAHDPYFGGIQPDPAEANLKDMAARMAAGSYDLGLCTDADGDRFGVVDVDGTYLAPNDVLALLIDYWAEKTKGPRAMAMSLVAGTIVERAGRSRGLEVFKTPVGFKYPGKMMAEGKVILACEESSGFAWTPHLPDKDGILACAMIANQVADAGTTIGTLKRALYDRLGHRSSRRLDLRIVETQKQNLLAKLRNTPPKAFAGLDVARVDQSDGVRLDLTGDNWVAFRASGTEPLVRVYMDAEDEKGLNTLQKEVEKYIALCN